MLLEGGALFLVYLFLVLSEAGGRPFRVANFHARGARHSPQESATADEPSGACPLVPLQRLGRNRLCRGGSPLLALGLGLWVPLRNCGSSALALAAALAGALSLASCAHPKKDLVNSRHPPAQVNGLLLDFPASRVAACFRFAATAACARASSAVCASLAETAAFLCDCSSSSSSSSSCFSFSSCVSSSGSFCVSSCGSFSSDSSLKHGTSSSGRSCDAKSPEGHSHSGHGFASATAECIIA